MNERIAIPSKLTDMRTGEVYRFFSKNELMKFLHRSALYVRNAYDTAAEMVSTGLTVDPTEYYKVEWLADGAGQKRSGISERTNPPKGTQICAYCENCCDDCIWIKSGGMTPVEGWEAIENRNSNGEYAGYAIISCPNFTVDKWTRKTYLKNRHVLRPAEIRFLSQYING